MNTLPTDVWYLILAYCEPLPSVLSYSLITKQFYHLIHDFLKYYIPHQLQLFYTRQSRLLDQLSREQTCLNRFVLPHHLQVPLYHHPLLNPHLASHHWVNLGRVGKRIMECLVWLYWDKQDEYEKQGFTCVPLLSGKTVLYTMGIPEWRESCIHVWSRHPHLVGSKLSGRLVYACLNQEMTKLVHASSLSSLISATTSITSKKEVQPLLHVQVQLSKLEPLLQSLTVTEPTIVPFYQILVGIALYWQYIQPLEHLVKHVQALIFQWERWSSRYILESH